MPFYGSELERSAVEIGGDTHDPPAFSIQGDTVGDQEAERDPAQDEMLKPKAVDPASDMVSEALHADVIERRDVGGKTGQVDEINVEGVAQEINEALENGAVGVKGVDEDEVFSAVFHDNPKGHQ